uniref:Uncharacterized protein n=1 Tax=Oryza barthii TaxID=65489 RepID=A0A0D3H4N4_9ORYZ
MSSAMAATAAAAAAQRRRRRPLFSERRVPVLLGPIGRVVKSSYSSSAMAPSVPTTSFLFCKICMEDVPTSHVHSSSYGSVRAFFFCAAFLASHITA